MAQTKKKRRTKHRGNAAGQVEVRGRTGRKPTESERGATARPQRMSAAERRMARLERPPTWRSAAQRGALTALVFLLTVTVIPIFDIPLRSAVVLSGFMLLVYIPMVYYTDLLLHRRHLKRTGRAPAA